jgi:starvation-inducible outer membrane lipoprotein
MELEGYFNNILDSSSRFIQKHVVPGEGYYRNTWYQMKVITETRRTRWRLLQKNVVPDEGYYRNTSYQMKVITETRRTRWRLSQKHVVPDEGYHRNAVSVITFIWYDVFL